MKKMDEDKYKRDLIKAKKKNPKKQTGITVHTVQLCNCESIV